MLAVALFLLVCSDYYQSLFNDDPQGGRNFFCDQEDLPPVIGPTGYVVTGHRTDCDVIAKDSMTYVYLHPQSEPDRPWNQVLRYDGDLPEVSWINSTHVALSTGKISDIGKLVAYLDGIHIMTKYIEVSHFLIHANRERLASSR